MSSLLQELRTKHSFAIKVLALSLHLLTRAPPLSACLAVEAGNNGQEERKKKGKLGILLQFSLLASAFFFYSAANKLDPTVCSFMLCGCIKYRDLRGCSGIVWSRATGHAIVQTTYQMTAKTCIDTYTNFNSDF